MKYLYFILCFCFNFNLAASVNEIISIEQIAVSFNLNVVSKGKPWTFPGVNTLYTNGKFSSAIMVMENVVGKKDKPKIIETKDFTIYEYPLDENVYNSVLFYRVDNLQLQSFLKAKKVVKWFNFFQDFIMGSAHASETGCSQSKDIRGSLAAVTDYYANDYFSLASKCMMGALEGVWDSTGGMVVSAYEGLKSLATDPVAFWNDKVKQFEKIKVFFADFTSSMKKMMAGFALMPNETKAQILCSIIGSIGTDVLITFFTAGLNSAKIVVVLNNLIGKFVKIEKLLIRLNQIGRIGEIPAEFFNKLALGKVMEKNLSSISHLINHHLDDFALQLTKCSI